RFSRDWSSDVCSSDLEHIGPAIDALLEQAEAAVEQAGTVSPVSWDSFVTPLEDATERLWRAWGQVSHLQAVVNTPELREAYNANLPRVTRDRKSTRLNSSHVKISYAVFCLKKKKINDAWCAR